MSYNIYMVPLCTRYRRHCTNFLVQRSRRSRRPPWPRPAARVHASSADIMAGPPVAVGTATEAVGGNRDVCSGPNRSNVWKRPWAPKAACAQSCRLRLPDRIETRPGSIHIRIAQISISRRDSVEIRSPGISNYIYIILLRSPVLMNVLVTL